MAREWDFLFTDEKSGEDFLVECETLEQAWEIVKELGFVTYQAKLTIEEGEILGLDTYC